MSLYRRPGSPYWWSSIPVGTKRIRFSTKRRDKNEARKVEEAELRKRLNRLQLGEKEEMSLREAIEKYLVVMRATVDFKNVESRTRKLIGGPGYEGRHHLDPDMLLSELATRHVEELRTARLNEGNGKRTINKEVATLQHIIKMAGEKWDVRVPARVVFEKYKVEDKLRWLTHDEATRLLYELDPERPVSYTYRRAGKEVKVEFPVDQLDEPSRRKRQDQYDLVVFLLDTGARYSEIAEITWDAIDTQTWRTVNIYRSKVGNEGVLTQTKRLRTILQRRWSQRRNSPYIFTGYGGELKPRGHATRGIQRAMDRAGLNAPHLVKRYGKATPHTLRDTFASWLVQKGVSLHKVQQLLGHSAPEMTQKYAHLVPDTVADEAAAVLDEMEGEANVA